MQAVKRQATAGFPDPSSRAGGGVDEAPPTALLGPLACLSCGEKVVWIRLGATWSLRDEDGTKHKCAKVAAA